MDSSPNLSQRDVLRPGRSLIALQLFAAVLLSAVLLLGLTSLLASGRLSLTVKAQWLLARQNSIWMGGVIVLAAAGAVYAMSR